MVGRLLAVATAGGLSLAGIAHLSSIHLPAPVHVSERAPLTATLHSAKDAQPASLPPVAPIPSAALALDQEVARLGDGFSGDVGIVVRDVQTGWTSQYRGLDYFPQQSVSKLWVALSLLDQIDRGITSLSDGITVRPEDLTLFHQPIRTLALLTLYVAVMVRSWPGATTSWLILPPSDQPRNR